MYTNKIKLSRLGNKFLNCYIATLLLLASLIMIAPITKADTPDIIATYYKEMGSLTQSSEFFDDETVIVNENIQIKPDDDKKTTKPIPTVLWYIVVGGVIIAMILIITFLFKTNILYIEEDQLKEVKPINSEFKPFYQIKETKKKLWKTKKKP